MTRRIRTVAFLLAICVAETGVTQDETVGPERGTLVIVGGGNLESDNLFKRFVELAGGDDAKIVIVPTAASSDAEYDYQNHKHAQLARKELGLHNIVVLHTHDREEADTKQFVAPIQNATGVWFTGGRQWRLADAYLGTLAEKEFHHVLQREGVIGGSSAGASIQASFLVRGDTKGNRILIGDHQYGFGFIKNSAIDQHVVPRNRQSDLTAVLSDPEQKMEKAINRKALLGIGIDEGTAIVVRQNEFEVIGKTTGVVLIHDPRLWPTDTSDDGKYIRLGVGSRYDLRHREVLSLAP